MITEGEAAILLDTTLRAFGNQSQSKQRSTLKVIENRRLDLALLCLDRLLDYSNSIT